MKQITINGRVLGIADVPGWASNFIIDDGDLFWEEHFTILPPGNWSILGRLNDITEEQAAGLVERWDSGRFNDYERHLARVDTATESLQSFFRSHGIEGNPLILLLNDKV